MTVGCCAIWQHFPCTHSRGTQLGLHNFCIYLAPKPQSMTTEAAKENQAPCCNPNAVNLQAVQSR